MSNLKNILFFFFCLNLALIVVNHIEIRPGVQLRTGNISPFLTKYDPINDMLLTINSTATSLSPQMSYLGVNSIKFTISKVLFLNVNLWWPVYIRSDGSNFFGFPIPYNLTDLPVLLGSILLEIVILLVNLFYGVLAVIILLIANTTIGAIPFYVSLFSLIDPALGTILGIAVGSVQMLYVFWGLTAFIPVDKKEV